MGKKRGFLPPEHCEQCGNPPNLGETLWPGEWPGFKWRCYSCLEANTSGNDCVSKSMTKTLQYAQTMQQVFDLENCGGSLYVRSHKYGNRRTFHYACRTHYDRGPESCPEPMLLPMADVDRAILDQIEQDILQPPIIAKAIEKSLAHLHASGESPDVRRTVLQKELKQIEAELARLTTAIATGGTLTTLLRAIQERENRRTQVQAELALLNGVTVTTFDAERTEEEIRSYLKDWSGLAQRHPVQTRQILRKLLPEKQRIRLRHDGHGRYRFTGEAAVGRLLLGGVALGTYPGVPNGIRTRVAGLKGRRPRPG